ncbi:MAG: hypothetical protein ACRC62_07040 [Microcoleus sp.]
MLYSPIADVQTVLGEQTDAVATSDTGTFSLLSLFKRSLEKLSALTALYNPTVTQSGGIGATFADLPVTGKLRRVVIQNRSGVVLFLQFHQKATPLATGDVPLNGQLYQVGNNGQVILAAADYGLNGTSPPANTRIGVSTSFGTFSAHASSNVSLFVETI